MNTITAVKPFVLFEKSTKKHLVVQYIVDRSQTQIDIRWHNQANEGELIPTDDGISLPLDLVAQVLETYLTLEQGAGVILDQEAEKPLVVQYVSYQGVCGLETPGLTIRRYYHLFPDHLKPGQGVNLPTTSYFARRVLEAVQQLVNEVA